MNIDDEIPGRIGDPVSTAEIEAFMVRLAVASPAGTDTDRIDQIGALEGPKSAAAAAQADDLVRFADSQVEDQAGRGMCAKDRGGGHRGADRLGVSTLAASRRADACHRARTPE